jgi:hypothetical protein
MSDDRSLIQAIAWLFHGQSYSTLQGLEKDIAGSYANGRE